MSEKLHGGKADGRPDSDFDAGDLAEGMREEAEHTDDPAERKEIAKDHLSADSDYYRKLKKIEKAKGFDPQEPIRPAPAKKMPPLRRRGERLEREEGERVMPLTLPQSTPKPPAPPPKARKSQENEMDLVKSVLEGNITTSQALAGLGTSEQVELLRELRKARQQGLFGESAEMRGVRGPKAQQTEMFGGGGGAKKEGEGSRGGKVIGHTKTGKAIYDQPHHPAHAGFNAGEQKEAEEHNQKIGWEKIPESKEGGWRKRGEKIGDGPKGPVHEYAHSYPGGKPKQPSLFDKADADPLRKKDLGTWTPSGMSGTGAAPRGMKPGQAAPLGKTPQQSEYHAKKMGMPSATGEAAPVVKGGPPAGSFKRIKEKIMSGKGKKPDDPDAVAAKVYRQKYGSETLTRRSVAARKSLEAVLAGEMTLRKAIEPLGALEQVDFLRELRKAKALPGQTSLFGAERTAPQPGVKVIEHGPRGTTTSHPQVAGHKGSGRTGEGSRGGKVIGHTPNGHPIYQSAKPPTAMGQSDFSDKELAAGKKHHAEQMDQRLAAAANASSAAARRLHETQAEGHRQLFEHHHMEQERRASHSQAVSAGEKKMGMGDSDKPATVSAAGERTAKQAGSALADKRTKHAAKAKEHLEATSKYGRGNPLGEAHWEAHSANSVARDFPHDDAVVARAEHRSAAAEHRQKANEHDNGGGRMTAERHMAADAHKDAAAKHELAAKTGDGEHRYQAAAASEKADRHDIRTKRSVDAADHADHATRHMEASIFHQRMAKQTRDDAYRLRSKNPTSPKAKKLLGRAEDHAQAERLHDSASELHANAGRRHSFLVHQAAPTSTDEKAESASKAAHDTSTVAYEASKKLGLEPGDFKYDASEHTRTSKLERSMQPAGSQPKDKLMKKKTDKPDASDKRTPNERKQVNSQKGPQPMEEEAPQAGSPEYHRDKALAHLAAAQAHANAHMSAKKLAETGDHDQKVKEAEESTQKVISKGGVDVHMGADDEIVKYLEGATIGTDQSALADPRGPQRLAALRGEHLTKGGVAGGTIYQGEHDEPRGGDLRETVARAKVEMETVEDDPAGNHGQGGLAEWFKDSYGGQPQVIAPVGKAKIIRKSDEMVVIDDDSPYNRALQQMDTRDSAAGLRMVYQGDGHENRKG